jgi:hypothetical protein
MKITLYTIIVLLGLVFVLQRCKNDYQASHQPKKYITVKIIKAKKEAIETDLEYEFDPLNTVLRSRLTIRQQPNVSTVYYLVFTDGSHKKVNLGEFVSHEVGDTIKTVNYY